MWVILRVTPSEVEFERSYTHEENARRYLRELQNWYKEEMGFDDSYAYDPRMDDRYEILEIDF